MRDPKQPAEIVPEKPGYVWYMRDLPEYPGFECGWEPVEFDLSDRAGYYAFRDYWMVQVEKHGDACFTERKQLLPHESEALDNAPLVVEEDLGDRVETTRYTSTEAAKVPVWRAIVAERKATLEHWKSEPAREAAKAARLDRLWEKNCRWALPVRR